MAKKSVRNCRVWMKPHHYMDGYVEGEYFHVTDDVYDGTSYKDMTGHRPSFSPIPVSKIEGKGHRIEYLD